MEETTQRKPMKKQEKSEIKTLSSLQKNEIRAKNILENEQKSKKEYTDKRIDQYIELKMLKGHSKEEATKMAKDLIVQQIP